MSMDALCPTQRMAALLRLLLPAAMFACLMITTELKAAPMQRGVVRTKNFVVYAPTAKIAKQVSRTAEIWRKRLAVEWLGKEMWQWAKPCTIRVKVGQLGAGGATTFSFDRGHVFGWKMRVQGTLERILDSVIPHEVSHTIFASHFRRPLPRWADEGAATLVEHESEKRVQQMRLKQVINTRRRIPLRKLLLMKDYPRDMHKVLVLYAEGYSLADYLVQQQGKRTYLRFLNHAYRNGWDAAIKRHYGFSSVEKLEKRWTGWIMAGRPRLDLPKGEALASRKAPTLRRSRTVVRGQSPSRERDSKFNDTQEESPVAPAPRRVGHRTSHPREIVDEKSESVRSLRATDGRLRTLKAGWVPIIRKRNTPQNRDGLSRTSLTHREDFQNRIRKTSFDEPYDRHESRVTTGRYRKASPEGGRPSPRDPQSDWSRFPHAKTVARPPDSADSFSQSSP